MESKTIQVSAKALTDEVGRRANNKNREVKARPKAWYLPSLLKKEIDTLLTGETVTKTYKSGNSYAFSLRK